MDYTKEVGSILNLRDEKHARHHITSKCILSKVRLGTVLCPGTEDSLKHEPSISSMISAFPGGITA